MTDTTYTRPDNPSDWTPLDWAIYNGEREAASTAERLGLAASDMRDKMERLARAVMTGRHISSLGEIQGSGSQLDILCALLDEQRRNVQLLKHYASQR